jgi:hypothetical protein
MAKFININNPLLKKYKQAYVEMKQKLVFEFPVKYSWWLLIPIFQDVFTNLRYFGSKRILPVNKINQETDVLS